MRGLRILADTVHRDWDSLVHSGVGLLLLLLIPAGLFVALEAERSEHRARIMVAGSARAPGVAERLAQVMGETSQVTVVPEPKGGAVDPFVTLKKYDLDILVSFEGAGAPSIYSAETDPRRLAQLEQLGAGVVRLEAMLQQRRAEEIREQDHEANAKRTGVPHQPHDRIPLFEQVWWARPLMYEDLILIGTLPVQPLAEYYPQAADPRLARLPTLILLVLSLLPFALAFALARDETAPLQVIAAPIVPAAVTVLDLLAILLLAETIAGVHIKAGVVRMALLIFVAAFAVALTALAIRALARTRVDIAVGCTVYALAVVLLTASPLGQRQMWVQAVAHLLPATHIDGVVSGWMFGAPYGVGAVWAAVRVVLLALSLATVVLALARRRELRASERALPARASAVAT